MNIPQAATQVASLAGGDVQMMFEVPVPFIGSLERKPAVSIVEVKSPSFQPVVHGCRTRSPSTTTGSAWP